MDRRHWDVANDMQRERLAWAEQERLADSAQAGGSQTRQRRQAVTLLGVLVALVLLAVVALSLNVSPAVSFDVASVRATQVATTTGR